MLAFLHTKSAISFNVFVGTNDILSVQMICFSANMFRQISRCTDKNSEKALLAADAHPPPPPPPPPLCLR